MSLGGKKLVILGIPWDVNSEGLRQYMIRFGELVDVMDRASGRSRGFGYVTFASLEDAEKALAAEHVINGRTLEVKVATPKEEMVSSSKKSSRVFVARIPQSVTDEDFHSYFTKYGAVIDSYMPKDPVKKQHRGIGFVTYEDTDSVDRLMSESHELGGSTVAVDRATPKDSRGYRVASHYLRTPHTFRMSNSVSHKNNDSFSGIILNEPQAEKLQPSIDHLVQEDPSAGHALATGDVTSIRDSKRHAAEGAPPRVEKKMFIGRIPIEATSEDLQAYFSQFGWVLDVYLPKDAKRISHRGFGFVTFADEASAARVARLRHFIYGREIAVDSASPTDRVQGGEQNLLPEVVIGLTTQDDDSEQPSTSSNIKWGKKIFIGRIPIEATAIDLRLHFSQFGHVLDVYLPKDNRKASHRGFGFVTFAEEISAEYASQKIHKIKGQKIVLDRAAPMDNDGLSTDPSSVVGRTIDGSTSTPQTLSRPQILDSKLRLPRDAAVTRPRRTSMRWSRLHAGLTSSRNHEVKRNCSSWLPCTLKKEQCLSGDILALK